MVVIRIPGLNLKIPNCNTGIEDEIGEFLSERITGILSGKYEEISTFDEFDQTPIIVMVWYDSISMIGS